MQGSLSPSAELCSSMSGVNGDAAFLWGSSAAMRSVERVIANIAHTNVPVLILGESGTGKRATAYQIHLRSMGSQQSFVSFPCVSMAPDIFMAQIAENGNGHENGRHGTLSSSFLGAGTLLLEEIGDLDSVCQPKLLQALSAVELDTARRGRLISSSKKNLDQEVRNGRFREDLYYRVNGVCLRIPPLRQRRQDIPALLEHFLAKFASLFQRPLPKLSTDTLTMLQEYSWPGNVRELENTARAMVAMEDEALALAALRRAPVKRASRIPQEGLSLKEAARAASRQAEREMILKVLTRTNWNRKRAAVELQISYKALLYKLKQTGIGDFVKQARA